MFESFKKALGASFAFLMMGCVGLVVAPACCYGGRKLLDKVMGK